MGMIYRSAASSQSGRREETFRRATEEDPSPRMDRIIDVM